MKELGYIIAKRSIKDIPSFVRIIHSEEEIEDKTKPYLVVGYKLAKEIYKEKFDILKKCIKPNCYWTFSKTERRTDYERDCTNFYDYLINNIVNGLKYYYINIFMLKWNKKKKLVKILRSDERKCIYICGDMVYIYYQDYVMGISLKLCKYCRLNVKKIFKIIYENPSNVVYTNDKFLDEKVKYSIKNKEYAKAYFISLIE